MRKARPFQYGIPGKRPSRLFRAGEVPEIAKHINSLRDIEQYRANPLEFLHRKRLLAEYGTDSTSDRAFIGLAKSLQPIHPADRKKEKPS